jgi:peptide/nickel transport system substrate-binding protein
MRPAGLDGDELFDDSQCKIADNLVVQQRSAPPCQAWARAPATPTGREVVAVGVQPFRSLLAAAVVLAAACAPAATTSSSAPAGPPQPGGTLTYLTGPTFTWSRGLDPASAGAAPSIYLSAIFGQLFQLAEGGRIEPDLAAGYEIADDGTTVTISLRPGVVFQDGTPLDAEAVAWNIRRDLDTPCVCSPASSWPEFAPEGITTPDDHTVVLHFSRPYAAVMNVFVSTSVNRIASPTAVQTMGEDEFRLKPVGAGPFAVVSNVVNSEIVLKRYDGYWKEGRPYLDQLVFKAIGGDQPAYQAILAGQAQAGTLTTPNLIAQASKNPSLSVTPHDGTAPSVIQLNTAVPPFDDKLAREAIYFATDVEAIRVHLFDGLYPATQSFTGPGGLFYQPEVPGYRTYDLERAKQIVAQLGGLRVELFGGTDRIAGDTLQTLQSQWQQAGIETTIHSYELPRMIQELESRQWQAALQSNGAFDPGVSSGVPFRFLSSAPYSGVHDPTLDGMIEEAVATLDEQQRAELYGGIARYISDEAYAPFMIATAPAAVARSGVHGPGLTSKVPMTSVSLLPQWDEAWIEKG